MSHNREMEESAGSEIAVVGLAGRFPGARSVDELWTNLRSGVESVSFFTDEELLRAGVPPEHLREPNYIKAGGVLDEVERFDAGFFGYSPREAALTDPQHRLFLETAWAALENAGSVPGSDAGAIGVYAGSGLSHYLLRHLLDSGALQAGELDYQTVLGNDKDFLTTRASYKLGLEGPSVVVQTACSTSLVAIHMACQALVSGECDMALAGGVTIRLPQKTGYFHVEQGAHSPDGHCRAFDANARGCIPGNGVAIVALKRLSDAIADEDFIHAVIKGSAVNNDGSAKVGFTAPRVEGQAQVIRSALAVSGCLADSIGYVECHGTGTLLGDPIEIEALAKAFREDTDRERFCAVGSIKTNFGHLDAAAGVAGFIKGVLSVRDGWIAPSLHFERPNPKIDFERSPFYVNASLRQWTTEKRAPRRSGVSAFGIGGTNAHVVLEEPPVRRRSNRSPREELLVLSAKTESSLSAARQNLARYLSLHPEVEMADAASTLRVGRAAFPHRLAVVASGSDAVVCLEDSTLEIREAERQPEIAFLFPGQGSQYPAMALGLYESERRFRAEVDGASEILERRFGFDLREALFPKGSGLEHAAQRLRDTAMAQPAIFVVSLALARLWESFGVRPAAMLGHSVGEYVAACLAGVFTLEDALNLVAVRGRIVGGLEPGSMLAVPLSAGEVRPLLSASVSIAAMNTPELTIVSGPTPSIEELSRNLVARGTPGRLLHTSHAFHSAMMDPGLRPFADEMEKVALQPPRIPFVSNLTGTWITPDQARDPGYWVRHLRHTVRFSEGLSTLQEKPRILLEVGPGRSLTALALRGAPRSKAVTALVSTRHPEEDRSDRSVLLETVGQLWSRGVEVDWRAFEGEGRGRRIPLPTYSFVPERHWIDTPSVRRAESVKRVGVDSWLSVPSWQRAPDEATVAVPAPRGDVWVIFADAGGIGAEVASRLEARGEPAVLVSRGRKFARKAERRYELDPGSRDNYRRLTRDLDDEQLVATRILHFWTADSDAEMGTELERLERAQDRGFFSLLYLTQALGDWGALGSCAITVVSSQVQSVMGDEAVDPAKAMVLGPCRTVPLEYDGIAMNHVDIPMGDAGSEERSATIELLWRTVTAGAPAPVTAIRGRHRWIQSFVPIRPSSKPVFEDGGVYWITGGLGGIGLALAEHIARTVRAKLVLTGRSALPHRLEEEEPDAPAGGASVLPSSDDLASLEKRIREGLKVKSMAGYPGLERTFDSLCSSYFLSTLVSGGIAVSAGETLEAATLRARLSIVPEAGKYFDMMLRALEDDGVLTQESGVLRFELGSAGWPSPEELHTIAQRARSRYPEFERIFEMLRHCARNLLAVLQGKVPALEVLYGEEGRDRFQAAIDNSLEHATVAAHLETVKEWLSRTLREQRERPLRILEVGGGQGLLTWKVMPALRGANVEYHFTDIGKAFVTSARKKAGAEGCNFMRFGVLDISKPPKAQGYAPRSFDVVLAFNVVHATSAIAETLNHLRGLLRDGGALLLLESVRPQRWVDLIWGLTSGWWAFEDTALRRGSPLLDLPAWERVLRENGFSGVGAYPRAAVDREHADSGVVVARTPPLTEVTSRGLAGSDRADALRRIESLGAEVLVARADVTDLDRMKAVLSEVEARFGSVRGVIHAALVLNDGAMHLKTREAAELVLGPKVRGTLVLNELFRNKPLDFFVSFSSMVALLGGAGQVDYCAASNFQDAFAQAARAHAGAEGHGLAKRVQSIDWAAWREVGMARRAALERGASPREVLPEGMSTAEGIEAFERALSSASPQVMVSPQPLDDLFARTSRGTEPRLRGELVSEPAPAALDASKAAPRNDAERIVASLWEELLGLERIGIHDNFFELGGDSVVCLQFIARAKKAGLQFTNSQVFERQTIAALVDSSGGPRDGGDDV